MKNEFRIPLLAHETCREAGTEGRQLGFLDVIYGCYDLFGKFPNVSVVALSPQNNWFQRHSVVYWQRKLPLFLKFSCGPLDEMRIYWGIAKRNEGAMTQLLKKHTPRLSWLCIIIPHHQTIIDHPWFSSVWLSVFIGVHTMLRFLSKATHLLHASTSSKCDNTSKNYSVSFCDRNTSCALSYIASNHPFSIVNHSLMMISFLGYFRAIFSSFLFLRANLLQKRWRWSNYGSACWNQNIRASKME